jgi:hypothetical protein
LYVRPETYGPNYVYRLQKSTANKHPLLNRKYRVFIKKKWHVGLKVSAEENIDWAKEKNVLFYYKNTRSLHGLYDHKTHCAFTLSVNIINSIQWRQWQTDRH